MARKAAPTAEAAAALEVLRDACDSDDPPPLGEAQAARDATVRQLVASLGRQGMHVLSTGAAVREGVHQLIKRARRIPPVPSLPLGECPCSMGVAGRGGGTGCCSPGPVPPACMHALAWQAPSSPPLPTPVLPPVAVYVAPPAPKATPRLPLVPPKFNPPNLSVPRPRKKSRGVKPSPEDAIRRDPRVITLFNELSRGTGVVAATVAWEAVRAELAAGGAPPGSARRGGTPTPGATPRSASATPRSGGLTPRRSTVSPAAAAAVRSPTTPSPRAASAAAAAEPEPEMSEEQAAAYAVTLPDRTAAVLAFQPSSLQDVSDFVSDVKAQGGDAPRSGCARLSVAPSCSAVASCEWSTGPVPACAALPWCPLPPALAHPPTTIHSPHRRHAAAGFPSARWRVMAEAAAVFDALLDACDRLTKWECPPGVSAKAANQLAPCSLPACCRLAAGWHMRRPHMQPCGQAPRSSSRPQMPTPVHPGNRGLQANVVAEAHRLASYLEEAGRAVARVAYAHDPLRVRMAKVSLDSSGWAGGWAPHAAVVLLAGWLMAGGARGAGRAGILRQGDWAGLSRPPLPPTHPPTPQRRRACPGTRPFSQTCAGRRSARLPRSWPTRWSRRRRPSSEWGGGRELTAWPAALVAIS